MKNPTVATLTQASDELKAGVSMKRVLATVRDQVDEDGSARLTYSQVWLFHTRREMDPAEFIDGALGSAEFHQEVAQARSEGQSWGYIAVRCGQPEGRVRKAWANATNLESKGLRIGKGGRWLDHDVLLYQDEAQKTGTALPVGTRRENYRDHVITPGYEEGLTKDQVKHRLSVLGRSTNGSEKQLRERLIKATATK